MDKFTITGGNALAGEIPAAAIASMPQGTLTGLMRRSGESWSNAAGHEAQDPAAAIYFGLAEMPVEEANHNRVHLHGFGKIGIVEERVPHTIPNVQFGFHTCLRQL